MTLANRTGLKSIISAILPGIITWCLWIRRSMARFEEKQQPISEIWRDIRYTIGSIINNADIMARMQVYDKRLMSVLNIKVMQKPYQVSLVRWNKPPPGWIKINTDGSSLGNPGNSGGGGIISDSNGEMKRAFSVFFGTCTNNEAELRAASEGLRICKEAGWHNIILETDSKLLEGWCLQDECHIWYLWDFWEEFRSLREGIRLQVLHQFREGNGIADLLAKQGAHGISQHLCNMESLPKAAKGMLRLKKCGLPYLKIR